MIRVIDLLSMSISITSKSLNYFYVSKSLYERIYFPFSLIGRVLSFDVKLVYVQN